MNANALISCSRTADRGKVRAVRARRALFLIVFGLQSACTCRGSVKPLDLGFRVAAETQALDFGRVLEGDTQTRVIILTAETRVGLTVALTVAAPFEVQPSVDLEGGGQIEVPVHFHAGAQAASAEVILQANGQVTRVKAKGVGVRAPSCAPLAPCRTSTYSLEEDRCLETLMPDDSRCEPASVCLEQGRCRAGECLGVARSCDDGNLCTVDACSMATGCVNSPRACPTPSNPCHVATCDPKEGCGETAVADLSRCGPVDCVTVNVCLAGECKTIPTPEGVQCAYAVACLGDGFCHEQKCQRVDAGPWLPEWTAPLAGSPSGEKPSLLEGPGGVFFELCDDVRIDAGIFDDAGSVLDAGELVQRAHCRLSSYTKSGFERFTAPLEDGAPRRLVHVSPSGVILLFDGGVEWRSTTTGALVHRLPTNSPIESPRAVSSLSDDSVVVALPEDDGGSRLVAWSDAGVRDLMRVGFSVRLLAVDEADGLLGWDPVSGTVLVQSVNGVFRVDGGNASLVTANGVTFAGTSHVLRTLGDGGVHRITIEWSDAGAALELEERPVLLGLGAGVVFYRRCESPVMSCLDSEKPMYARVLNAETGALEFEREVLPAGEASLDEAALLSVSPGSVVTFVRGALDGGATQAIVEIMVAGQPTVLCRLPNPMTDVRGVLFSAGRMLVLDDRGPAGAVLQSYGLGVLPVQTSQWAQPDGFSGTRRPRP